MSVCLPRRRFLERCSLLAAGAGSGLLLGQWCRAPGGALAEEPTTATPEQRIAELKLALPPVGKPVATYVPTVQVGNLLFVAGHGPRRDGQPLRGKVGDTMTLDEANAAARLVGLIVLSTVRTALGTLDRVERLVKTLGMVNAVPDFTQHPQVINGFSDLMVEVFGETRGKGARSAVGMGSLPGGIPVEIECVFQVRG